MRKGFSLIELSFVLIILLFMIPAIVNLSVLSLKMNIQNSGKEEAIYKANKLSNFLSSLEFLSSCLKEGNYTCSNNPCCDGFYNDSSVSYNVTDVYKGLKKIYVRVVYRDSGREREVKLVFLKGQR